MEVIGWEDRGGAQETYADEIVNNFLRTFAEGTTIDIGNRRVHS
jgi:hypothetical protein